MTAAVLLHGTTATEGASHPGSCAPKPRQSEASAVVVICAGSAPPTMIQLCRLLGPLPQGSVWTTEGGGGVGGGGANAAAADTA